MIEFMLIQHGDPSFGISTVGKGSSCDRIRQVYGSTIANELLDFNLQCPKYGFSANGMISHANYNLRKVNMLLFINRS